MRSKRPCQHCGKTDHMIRVIDAKAEVYDVRYRICYRCHPELDSTSHLNGPEGGLRQMKSEFRDSSWDVCTPMLREKSEEDAPEKYADDDTVLDAAEMTQ